MATAEPTATKSAHAKAAPTKPATFEASTPTAETAVPEVSGALPTIAPPTEVLLALSTLHAGLVVLIELGEVRCGASARSLRHCAPCFLAGYPNACLSLTAA